MIQQFGTVELQFVVSRCERGGRGPGEGVCRVGVVKLLRLSETGPLRKRLSVMADTIEPSSISGAICIDSLNTTSNDFVGGSVAETCCTTGLLSASSGIRGSSNWNWKTRERRSGRDEKGERRSVMGVWSVGDGAAAGAVLVGDRDT